MANIVQADLIELTNSEHRRISIGLKPSGLIHLGTAVTLLHGMLVLKNNPGATLDVTVMDLELVMRAGTNFVPYQVRKDTYGCHDLMRAHTRQEAVEVLTETADYLDIDSSRVRISMFSKMTEHSAFQNLLMQLFEHGKRRTMMKRILRDERGSTGDLVAPICDTCQYSSTNGHKLVDGENGVYLAAWCKNPECPTDTYEVKLTQPRRVNIFYLIDPIRDLVPNDDGRIVDLHIFGGDYGLPYGVGRTPRAHRVQRLMSLLSENPPDIYIGPILMFEGKKLGKSRQNNFSIAAMKGSFPNWIERVHQLLMDNPTEKVLDLSQKNQYFS
ncbi:hypothetical protein HY487_00010 [Candidatus Woesearchaeota archaeon]|nr:hypothetical protein [Candidatus Woesearchaeota archaeon]